MIESIGSIDLEVTLRCNLKCPYCYLNLGSGECKDISEEIMNQCIELMKKYRKGNSVQKVTFYGGEPLLRFDLIKKFVSMVNRSGLNVRYTIMSNGTIMTEEIVDFVKRNKVYVQRSIDGCPKAMEKLRPGALPLYEKATEMLKDKDRGVRRMTITPDTAEYLFEGVLFLWEKGFRRGFSPQPDYNQEWNEEQKKALIDNMWKMADFYIEQFKHGNPFYWYQVSREAACRFSNTVTQTGCGAGKRLYAISVDGYVFLCHRFTGEDINGPFCYGHVAEVLEGTAIGFGNEVLSAIESRKRKEWNEECYSCIAQYGCEKGCYHSSYKATGNLLKPPELYCRIKREAAKIVTYIDCELRNIDSEWWLKKNFRREAKAYINRKKKI